MDTNKRLPEEPEKRRVIMVLSRQDLNQLQIDAKSNNSARELFLNNQVSVLDDSAIDDSPLIQKLKGSGLLNPGSILIQSPYDTSLYADASSASYSFAQAKCMSFSILCGLLAAKKVSVKQMEINTSDITTEVSAKADVTEIAGKVDFRNIAFNRMQKVISINQKYAQGEAKIEYAKSYLLKHQWLSDVQMTGLLYLREAKVPIEEHEFILSLTEESKKNLKVAFDLEIPIKPTIPIVGQLMGNLQKIKQETFDFSLTINVEFWN
ncbi:MAG: hypothetical protein HEQ26_15310 [Dolichospermum sp. DL01]|nr:MAG: hypothetical protein HEQ26_15310 [Dolichospermum sp. DL01]